MIHPHPYSIKRHGTTLEKCEHEPVQTPGCVQAHGVLFAVRKSDLTILQASENCRLWLGPSAEDLLGQSLSAAIGQEGENLVRKALDRERLDRTPLYVTTVNVGRGDLRPLHVSVHTMGPLALVELEAVEVKMARSPDELRVDPDYYGLVRTTLSRLQQASNLGELSRKIAEEVRRITEMDRVMIYFFHPDASGEIVAEAKAEGKISWMGWRYPAHDIPKPAREIFKKIWSRPVPDVRGELHEMVPLLNPDTQEPLDMTYCSVRGASVMYTEYLDNMGVRAALTLPLIKEGELWGLVACHHDTPKIISYDVRAACEYLARAASLQLQQAEEKGDSKYRSALEAANYALISKAALQLELGAFTEGDVNLASCLDCGGAAIFYRGVWETVGKTPDPGQLKALHEWLLIEPEFQFDRSDTVFVTDHLSGYFPPAKAFRDTASGLIAFCFSKDPLGLVLYFKPETLQTLTWAGNPYELPLVEGPHGPRLSPRKSFEVWRETVSDRSMPWKTVEIEAITRLRSLILDFFVSREDRLNVLRSELATSIQKAASADERFRIAVEAGNLGTWDFIPSTGHLEWSVRCKALFNLPADAEVDYAKFLALVHPEDREKTDRLVQQALIPDGSLSFATDYRTNLEVCGKEIWIHASGTAILDDSGKVGSFIGTVQDITEMVRARESIAERQKELQRLVDERTIELRNTVGELEAFSYSVSHDMRSPLRAMQGFSQALLEEYGSRLDEKGKNYLGRIERGARRLDLLIQDVLSYSRVAKSELALEPVNLGGLLDEIRAHHLEFCEPRATVNFLGEFPPVIAHEAFLSQVLTNLLGNAVKFQMPGAKPVVSVTAERENRALRISIRDNGIGMDPSHHQRIFEIFGRIYPDKKYEGTGIGLAIVRKAVHRMGGEIGVESSLGKGSHFWFTLPTIKR